MATWEFTSEHSSSYDIDGLIQKLNARAEDGWEVVTIIPTGGDVTAFFKREQAVEKEEKEGEKVSTPSTEKEAAPVAGGFGGVTTAGVSRFEDKLEEEKAEEEKPFTTVGARDEGGSRTSFFEETKEAETAPAPEPVKEPSGWAVAPEVAAAGAAAAAAATPVSPMAAAGAATPAAATPTSPMATAGAATPEAGAPGTTSGAVAAAGATTPGAAAPAREPMAPIGGTTPGAAAAPATPAAAMPATPSPAPAPPTPAPAPVVTTPAGWYPDPSGRFEMRYWDGQQWTEYVSRAGQQYTDPPVA